jgi:hypothetical protein
MNRLPLAFFTVAALCALGGMLWGIDMGRSGDHGMMPAHAHLNLVGWASLALMGTFYALSGPSRLGWLNFALSTAGVVVMIPALALVLSGNKAMETATIVGSTLALLGMLTFVAAVLSHWRAPRSA